jgi:hypothetical protein
MPIFSPIYLSAILIEKHPAQTKGKVPLLPQVNGRGKITICRNTLVYVRHLQEYIKRFYVGCNKSIYYRVRRYQKGILQVELLNGRHVSVGVKIILQVHFSAHLAEQSLSEQVALEIYLGVYHPFRYPYHFGFTVIGVIKNIVDMEKTQS